jgi:hypothetical protein
MSIYATAGQTIFSCNVGGQGTANGWTFTLPAGIQDNDSFQISGDNVQFKSAITYYCKTYNIRVQGVNGSSSALILQPITIKERGMKSSAATGTGVSYNSTICNGWVNSSATVDTTVEFAFYIPTTAAATVAYCLCARTSGTNITTTVPTQATTVLSMLLDTTTSPNVTLYVRNPAGTLITTHSAISSFGLVRGNWYSCKITWSAAASTVVTLDINGIQSNATASANNHIGGATIQTDGIVYTGSAISSGTNYPIIADLRVIQAGFGVITDPMTAQHSQATLVGTPTFNQVS